MRHKAPLRLEEHPARTLKIGNTIVKIIAPPPQTPEEIQQILTDFHRAGWRIIEELVEQGKMTNSK